MPHRIELWANLKRIKSVGYKQWLKDLRENYACPRCRTLNSAYDLKCRRCGEEPSCRYIAEHKRAIEKYLKNR
jgi:tRNA(Ile2) C34 agmatinyltransferase TiaS